MNYCNTLVSFLSLLSIEPHICCAWGSISFCNRTFPIIFYEFNKDFTFEKKKKKKLSKISQGHLSHFGNFWLAITWYSSNYLYIYILEPIFWQLQIRRLQLPSIGWLWTRWGEIAQRWTLNIFTRVTANPANCCRLLRDTLLHKNPQQFAGFVVTLVKIFKV